MGLSVVNNFSSSRGNLPSPTGHSNPDDFWADYGYSYPNWTASLLADLTLGNNMLISLRAGSFLSDTTGQRVQPAGTRFSHRGKGTSTFPEIPSGYQRPLNWTNYSGSVLVSDWQVRQRAHLDADISYYVNLWGEHALKLGATLARAGEDVHNVAKYPVVSLYWDRPAILYGVNYGRGQYGYYTVSGGDVAGPYGYVYDTRSDRWSLYLQDSWTIASRLTINAGLRTEKEYIPNYYNDPLFRNIKPIDFRFDDKLAPRVGFVYDLDGGARVKIFGSYGLYYDVMKLYMAGTLFGGYKMKQAYFALESYEWDKIGVWGDYPGTLLKLYNYYPASEEAILERVDPGLKPMSQREVSLGVEKQLSENTSATFRFVQKHLRSAVEDVGVLVPGEGEMLYTTNPGYGISRWTTHGGKFDPAYPETPKAKREYWGFSFSLDKRFADNWLAGLSYTWSSLTGNYSGLANSDEFGRSSPNVERSFDLWYMAYDKDLIPIDGPLATDREHYFKLFGAYTLPFGLTAGAVINAMSGTPVSEKWYVIKGSFMPYGRGNLGRTPFLWFANLYAEYALPLGKTSLSFNVNVDNVFNVSTARMFGSDRAMFSLELTEGQLLSRSWSLNDPAVGFVPNPMYTMQSDFYAPISARLGIRFSF